MNELLNLHRRHLAEIAQYVPESDAHIVREKVAEFEREIAAFEEAAARLEWVMVPKEPTRDMIWACKDKFVPRIALPIFVAAYKTMIAAAPAPAAQPLTDEQIAAAVNAGPSGVRRLIETALAAVPVVQPGKADAERDRADAERYRKWKARAEAHPDAKDGYAALGHVFPTFDEAFDAVFGAPAQETNND